MIAIRQNGRFEKEVHTLPGEESVLGIPGKKDRDIEFNELSSWLRHVEPLRLVRACDVRFFEYTLWPNDNVLQIEMDVWKRGKQLLVEAGCAFFAMPVGVFVDDGINAIIGQCCHKSGNVMRLLGKGMGDPEFLNGSMFCWIISAAQKFDNIRR